jgi:hypothetical protein
MLSGSAFSASGVSLIRKKNPEMRCGQEEIFPEYGGFQVCKGFKGSVSDRRDPAFPGCPVQPDGVGDIIDQHG